MKTFRMIGMALLAVLVSANLTSCDKDDDGAEENAGQTDSSITLRSGKKLVRATEYRGEGESPLSIKEFKYDEKGRVIESTYKYTDDSSERIEKIFYSWDSDKITLRSENEEDGYGVFKLVDGKVSTYSAFYPSGEEWGRAKFAYDKGYIKEYASEFVYEGEVEVEDGSKYVYTWDNDRLSSVESSYEAASFHYDGQTCKGVCPIFDYYAGLGWDIMKVHSELFGMETVQLPSKYVREPITTKFNYELDSDGYVVSCTFSTILTYEEGSEAYELDKGCYKFEWE